MHNRQNDEILRDILTFCNDSSAIAIVMFHAYMTHRQAKAYLQLLAASGLVARDPFDNLVHTTPKGMKYLAMVEQVKDLLPVASKRTRLEEHLVSSFAV